MKHHQLTIMVVAISVLVFFATLQAANTGMAVTSAEDSCVSKQMPDAYIKGRAFVVKNGERKIQEDACMNDATTVKYYCLGNELKTRKIFCGFNEYCYDGVCKKGKK